MQNADSQEGSFDRQRLTVIVSGMILAWVLGGAGALIYLYAIPSVKVEIGNRESEIASLKPAAKKVTDMIAATERLKQKIVVLENLDRSRIRTNRLLSRVGEAVSTQDGTWLKQLSITRARDPKRLRLLLQGFAAGSNEQEMQKRISGLLEALEAKLAVLNAEKKALENSKLGAIFERPVLLEVANTAVTTPPSPGRPARKLSCRSFSMEVVFEPLEPLTQPRTNEKLEDFKFDSSLIKRDPFVCPEK